MAVTQVTIDVPGSSANLGPGYDCLAIALPLRLRVTAERRPGPLSVQLAGEGASSLPQDASNLVVSTLLAELDERGDDLAVTIENEIPLGAGCGSSAAAIVAALASHAFQTTASGKFSVAICHLSHHHTPIERHAHPLK